jgi:hypothetical protein
MKDRFEVAFVVRTAELSGKVAKALAPSVKEVAKTLKPFAERLLEVLTTQAENEIKK